MASLRAAVDAKCRDCIYDQEAPGTWREQVAQCSCARCPLWPHRPAPSGGPFANPPREPADIPAGWLAAPIGDANSPHPPRPSRVPLATPAAQMLGPPMAQNAASMDAATD